MSVFCKTKQRKIAEVLLARTCLIGGDTFHNIHNYIDTDEMILRKGASYCCPCRRKGSDTD